MKLRPMSAEDPILQRLSDVAGRYPDLCVAVRLYESILPMVRDTELRIAALELDRTKIETCLKKGVPVLSVFDLEVESHGLKDLLFKLAAAVESMDIYESWLQRWKIRLSPPDPAEISRQAGLRSLKAAAGNIRRALEDGFLDPDRIMGLAAVGRYTETAEIADCLTLDAELLWTLARNALKPALHICRRNIMELVTTVPWDKMNCFVCGSQAILGELRDNEQEKRLRCGQCGADWHVSRLECTCCGNLDHATQRYLFVDGCDSRRIEACDVCGGYLKVISAFTPTHPEMLAVEDLATLHLDYIAQQNGYAKVESLRADVK